jgi:hypothetical protein
VSRNYDYVSTLKEKEFMKVCLSFSAAKACRLWRHDYIHLSEKGTVVAWRSLYGVLKNLHNRRGVTLQPMSAAMKFTPCNDRQVSFFTYKSPFSNMYVCKFTIDGISYSCSEQYIS